MKPTRCMAVPWGCGSWRARRAGEGGRPPSGMCLPHRKRQLRPLLRRLTQQGCRSNMGCQSR